MSDEGRSLRVAFESEESFRREYQTNIANGGIFIATNVGFAAREVVRVEIALEYCDEHIELEGEIVHVVAMSALNGFENADFLNSLDGLLASDRDVRDLKLPQGDGAAISWLYRHADVLSRDDRGDFAHLEVSIAPEELARFKKNHPNH